MDLKLFQKDAAKMIGVDETSIWNWENNQSKPVSKLLPKIIGFLGYCPLFKKTEIHYLTNIHLQIYSFSIFNTFIIPKLPQ